MTLLTTIPPCEEITSDLKRFIKTKGNQGGEAQWEYSRTFSLYALK
jgi:hypothetical protein